MTTTQARADGNALAIIRNETTVEKLVRIKAEKQVVRHAMKDVMKENTHFGTIPGTPKPTLYDAGATTVLSLFHIALDPEVTDLSTSDEIRYRVRAVASHAPTKTHLGSALGEASSNEEKYRWRKVVCQQEFDATPEDRRRLKWKAGYQNKPAFSVQQIRAEPADIANTVLKMAVKRARVATVLQVTGAGDVFSQDLEDLPPEIAAGMADEAPAPVVAMPQRVAKDTVIDTPPVTPLDQTIGKEMDKLANTPVPLSPRPAPRPSATAPDQIIGSAAPAAPITGTITTTGKVKCLVLGGKLAGKGWVITTDADSKEVYIRTEPLFDAAMVAAEIEEPVFMTWEEKPSPKKAGTTYIEATAIVAAGVDA
jgi:hypothetical protein